MAHRAHWPAGADASAVGGAAALAAHAVANLRDGLPRHLQLLVRYPRPQRRRLGLGLGLGSGSGLGLGLGLG